MFSTCLTHNGSMLQASPGHLLLGLRGSCLCTAGSASARRLLALQTRFQYDLNVWFAMPMTGADYDQCKQKGASTTSLDSL